MDTPLTSTTPALDALLGYADPLPEYVDAVAWLGYGSAWLRYADVTLGYGNAWLRYADALPAAVALSFTMLMSAV